MLFRSRVEDDFNIEAITSETMDKAIDLYQRIYKWNPPWVDGDDNISTINFAKAICSETARLATLAIGVNVDGSARAEWIQAQIDKIYFQLRHWVEYGCAYGTIILKPNGNTVDMFSPDRFIVTAQKNGEIAGVVFISQEQDASAKKWYTRLEYHRFMDDGLYAVSNRCYVGYSSSDMGKPVDIKLTPWPELMEDAYITDLEKPLFGVFRTPQANNIDVDSPLGIAVFADAIEELKDLDIAYSRNAKEILDSKRTVLLDSDRLLPNTGTRVNNTLSGFNKAKDDMKLPDYVKAVYGTGGIEKPFYEEINPTLQTDMRMSGINALLGQIGYKCGFSNGYFVFNEKQGFSTATQVEADQQRTIQFIKDVRDKLESCLDGLIYALDKFADLYSLAPVGAYEVTYDFGDITYNEDEDRARWYGYVVAGKIPFWYFLMKFEGFSEEEAKAIEKQARPKEPTLYGEEE